MSKVINIFFVIKPAFKIRTALNRTSVMLDTRKLCTYTEAFKHARYFFNNYDTANLIYIIHDSKSMLETLEKNIQSWKSTIDKLDKVNLKGILLVSKDVEVTPNNKYIIYLQHYFMLIILLYNLSQLKSTFKLTLDHIIPLCHELCGTTELKYDGIDPENNVLDKMDSLRLYKEQKFNDIPIFTSLIAVIGFLEYYKDQ